MIAGRVTDPTGAIVAAVTITATADTGVAIHTRTTADGHYVLAPLVIGLYRVSIGVPGFRRAVSDAIRVHANTRARLNSQRFGWIALRDVFDVDGRPVRDREERLSRLFAQAVTPDSLRQARSLAAEGSRFNLNAPGVVVDRTINTPMVALMCLRTSEQPRSSFRRGKTGQIDGRPYVTLDFSERAKPALIGSNAEATTEGTFWIDAEAGRVLQSELRVESVLGTRLLVKARIKVRYARVAKLDLWLPDSMDEQYELDPSRQLITGRAIYSNCRQFAVTTSEGAK